MTNPAFAHEAEAVPVQLTRIEGDVKLILFQITDVSRRTGTLEGQMSEQQLVTQQLRSDATAATKAVVDAETARKATAEAVQEADEKRVATAKALVDQSTNTWMTPLRLAAVFGTVFAGVGVVFAIFIALKG